MLLESAMAAAPTELMAGQNLYPSNVPNLALFFNGTLNWLETCADADGPTGLYWIQGHETL